MKHRVWVYLKPDDAAFLDIIGGLIGTSSRHEQIEFAVKLCRLIIPDAHIVPYVLSKFHVNNAGGAKGGVSARYWVYLNEDDMRYLEEFSKAMRIKSRSKTIRYVIKMVKLFLLNTEFVSETVNELLMRQS